MVEARWLVIRNNELQRSFRIFRLFVDLGRPKRNLRKHFEWSWAFNRNSKKSYEVLFMDAVVLMDRYYFCLRCLV